MNRYISMIKLVRLLDAGHSLEQLLDSAGEEQDTGQLLMRMAQLFQIFNKQAEAAQLQNEALRHRQLYHLAADIQPTALQVLVILAGGFMLDNTPVGFLIDGSNIACELLYVTESTPLPEVLPVHDVVFVAAGHFERHLPIFKRIVPLLAQASVPVLNRPRPDFGFERDTLNALLRDIPGVIVPPTYSVSRAELEQLAMQEDVGFPLIVRPLRSQAGKGLARLECVNDIGEYLAAQEEPMFYLAPYIDYRSPDRLYRKCRLVLIAGKAYACHYAISSHWVVHYQSAGMEQSARRREEEARFMADFDHGFGLRHAAALEEIGRRIGLDYVVIDCGETPGGQLLFFEADNVSFVHATDSADMYPYKQVQMDKVFAAFRAMLAGVAHG
ncbi:ATP-grasp domain-containing protein [Duganella levis]|uniref:RimK family alpha-L-glutamate ligase n=1 Tax=Duganella levis TaxID=2692169 RepID=A0ABW9VTG4_9BURK|nr:RimK family alpha-L-glutamate ligase [Duganella levis]MYN24922.1 RimK family alpha-L-glutamate ligase [Duganella levis]